MKDTIYRQDALDAMTTTLWHYPNECYRNLNEYEFAKGLAELGLKSVPSAQPRLNKKRISDLLWNEYRTMSPHLSAEGVVARRYYCKELWKELFGKEETPVWMTW